MRKSLSEITEVEIKTIESLAALFFIPQEIALMLEINEAEFLEACNDENSQLARAFNGGFLQGQVDLRTGVMKMAKAGSSPAQTMGMELLKKAKVKMLDP